MWRMQDANRVLTEAEWSLFSTGLDLLRDTIEEDIRSETDGADTGIPVFDRLTPEQKLALLADTAQALRDPATPMPHHTAVNREKPRREGVGLLTARRLAAAAAGQRPASGSRDARIITTPICGHRADPGQV